MKTLKVVKLNKYARLPTRGSGEAAGYDLYSLIEDSKEIVWPAQRKLFKTGIAMEIPTGYVGIIKPRSGLALRNGGDILAGVIDSDYRGEIGVILHNEDDHDPITISNAERIAQIIFIKHESPEIVEVSSFDDDTDRGDGGFGSTGS
jgi:dUTP pyrophosphatase